MSTFLIGFISVSFNSDRFRMFILLIISVEASVRPILVLLSEPIVSPSSFNLAEAFLCLDKYESMKANCSVVSFKIAFFLSLKEFKKQTVR